MISVAEALSQLFDQIAPLDAELVPLRQAGGRVLVSEVSANRNQPPFPSSVMDGYAVRGALAKPGARFRVVGEAAAGHRFEGEFNPQEAVRIFTGAPVPMGLDRVIIQEDVTIDGDWITLNDALDSSLYVREAGSDFAIGDEILPPKRLTGADLSLLAAMNIPEVPVARRPSVALIATGDELVMPGEKPGEDQIIASNIFGLAELIEAEGGIARILPIARDNKASLVQAFELAQGNDLIVTIGGASVGDHDLVGDVAMELGLQRAFYKIAMRPGKPLMSGRIGASVLLGLPGNPVSALVCGHIFLRPALRAMQGLPAVALPRRSAPLSKDVGPNGPREHYMRASLASDGVKVAERQDSALLSVLAEANILAIRPPRDPARKAGELVEYIDL